MSKQRAGDMATLSRHRPGGSDDGRWAEPRRHWNLSGAALCGEWELSETALRPSSSARRVPNGQRRASLFELDGRHAGLWNLFQALRRGV